MSHFLGAGASLVACTFAPRLEDSEAGLEGGVEGTFMDEDLLIVLQNGSLTRYRCFPTSQQENANADHNAAASADWPQR